MTNQLTSEVIYEKYCIKEIHNKRNPQLSQAELKNYFNDKYKNDIGRSTIFDILNNKKKYSGEL